jgi:hypothetical protein
MSIHMVVEITAPRIMPLADARGMLAVLFVGMVIIQLSGNVRCSMAVYK